jgi:(2Fe-2S) ferredoxin
MNNYYKYHIFICLNERDDGAQCCSQFNSLKIFDYMKQKIKSLNLRGKGLVRINRSGCFDRCSEGPMLVVYPDIDEIIQSHIINNTTVERLMI